MSNFHPNTPDPRWRSGAPRPEPVIDMTPDGRFIEAPQPGIPPIPAKILGIAILVTIAAGALAIALLALWLAMTLIPIVIGAALVAFVVFRVQLWLARRRSLGGHRNVVRS
jgi:hypothetical protein